MSYRIEVLTRTYHVLRGDEETWRPLHGVGQEPYTWATKREAEAMLDLCYPGIEHAHRVRITALAEDGTVLPAEVT